jgi:hypothetical protein
MQGTLMGPHVGFQPGRTGGDTYGCISGTCLLGEGSFGLKRPVHTEKAAKESQKKANYAWPTTVTATRAHTLRSAV